MCLFNRHKETPQTPAKRKALLFAINNYPGTENDLNGCINDQADFETRLKQYWPDFAIRKFKDSQVTRKLFMEEITTAIAQLRPGDHLLVHYSGHGTQTDDRDHEEADGYDEAVFLWDGCVIDDDIGDALQAIPDGATVTLLFDSCFSGTVTRHINRKARYVQNPAFDKRTKKRTRIPKEKMTWIVISGCREDQTSDDAFINGRYNGAFSYFAVRALKPGITYFEYMTEIRKSLPSKIFSQEPTLEGDATKFNNVIFN